MILNEKKLQNEIKTNNNNLKCNFNFCYYIIFPKNKFENLQINNL